MGLTLQQSAARIGGYRWTEVRLFEIFGATVGALDDPLLATMADRHAGHAAWRATQWWDRLPVLAGVDRDVLVVPPSSTLVHCLDELASSRGPARIAGVYRVALPRLASAYRAHLRSTSLAADGPVQRTLRHALADADDDRVEGETFLQSILVDAVTVDIAAASVAGLERLLLVDAFPPP